jgi:hypothetical protein
MCEMSDGVQGRLHVPQNLGVEVAGRKYKQVEDGLEPQAPIGSSFTPIRAEKSLLLPCQGASRAYCNSVLSKWETRRELGCHTG